MPVIKNAEPVIVYIKNLKEAYSLFSYPQPLIIKKIGININSHDKKNKNKSDEINTPFIPPKSKKHQIKNSFTLSSISVIENKRPVKKIMKFKIINEMLKLSI
jgi:hypothetical protein